MTLSEELTWRGFVNQMTFKDIKELDDKKRTFYWGVDPSADSMQIGNFAAAMMVRHFINYGYSAILLVGGATGMIGDPDGKDIERNLKPLEEVAKNKKAIAAQYNKVFAGQEFEIVDNYDWFKDFGYMDFLRTIGKHVPMRQMLGREFVQTRLSEDGAGISYAEFSYSLIQGYDFLHLFKEKNATLQVCGADQWGNSIAGVDLIRRIAGGEAHVYTTPLVINKATGKKFGKTEDGAIWLDENKTSIYKFYQFWLNADDEGVEDYMKIYTLFTKDQLENVMKDFRLNPGGRIAQKTLAYEVTALVHGKNRADSVKKVSETLFGDRNYSDLTTEDFELMKQELPCLKAEIDVTMLTQVLVEAGLATSNTEARRFLESSAVYINGEQLPLNKTTFGNENSIQGFAVLRVGKNKNCLVTLS
jgi:tyrosyl-tRNA synthetase